MAKTTIHDICWMKATGLRNARFSPMSNGVATLYGGENTAVAIMETLFHDLPLHSDGAPFDLRRAEGLVHSVIKSRLSKPGSGNPPPG